MMTPSTKARPVSQIERMTIGRDARTERLLLCTTIDPDAAELKMAVTGKRAYAGVQSSIRVLASVMDCTCSWWHVLEGHFLLPKCDHERQHRADEGEDDIHVVQDHGSHVPAFPGRAEDECEHVEQSAGRDSKT